MAMRLVSLLAVVAAPLCPVIVVIAFVLPAVPPIEVFPLHVMSMHIRLVDIHPNDSHLIQQCDWGWG